ncbi:MAG: phosphatase PAP2 family protein [Verrucomicrobiaceae bacterium]|nr:MAG: phosphatase PAP2 family protein [Verrucomicrobiaceae bacterium]
MKHAAKFVFLFLLLAGLCPAKESPAWPMPPVSYFAERIPPPPKEGDAADLSDLEYVLAVQACATSGQIAHTRMTARLDPFEIFSEVLGPKFTTEKYPLTKALLEKVRDTGESVKDELKAWYARKRPVDAHEKDGVVSYVGREKSFSYPSGHALRGWLTALVLARLDPKKKNQLLNCGAAVGWDRVVAGVHYQTDTIASRAVGRLIFDKLMADPAFAAELEKVKKAEWAQP